jgi:23S rRNA (pseudouridine1915-N3)-methyltransferase
MKLHIVTVGEPKLTYAKLGWEEYLTRLKRFHDIRITHVPDKYAYDEKHLNETMGSAYKVVLEIKGKNLSSEELAAFLEKRAIDSREICCIIGGPEGLPISIRESADLQWSFSHLTLPHDLAMVVLAEALYRASSINAGLPYHK